MGDKKKNVIETVYLKALTNCVQEIANKGDLIYRD